MILNRYKLGDKLGSGGMGEVYRGLDAQTDQSVAIKALRTDVVDRYPAMIERFQREGEVLRQLNHPNIVRVLDVVVDADRHYLVMELVEGGALRDVLKAQPQLPVDRVLTIGLELADALARAHHLNIIHRDIKPDNVLLAPDGTPRLTDFGVAHVVDAPDLTSQGEIVGTFAYLSPEALQGQPPDSRTDIWAFGVMLYEMLAGRRPFTQNTPYALILAIASHPIATLDTFRDDVPPALADLVYTMLEKDPARRANSMRAVGASLEAIKNGDAPSPLAVTKADVPSIQVDVSGDDQTDSSISQKMLVVVFYTDIENSTRKWEQFKDLMGAAIAQHDSISAEVIGKHSGRILRHRGDGISAIFDGSGNPLMCAIEMQQRFEAADWGDIGQFRIRIALHAGQVEKHDYESAAIGQQEEYFGTAMNRTARILDTGYGGQILLTPAVAELLDLPSGASLKDLGDHRLKDLPEPQKIYGLLHPDLPLKEFPPLKSLSTAANNLPTLSTSFVGREDDIATLRDQLNDPDCRLVTILGPGGMGKTRLSLAVAETYVGEYAQGVYFVELAPVEYADGIVPAIAKAIGFQFYEGQESQDEQLLNYLREKHMLLVLDNFEHLAYGAGIIDDILSAAPQVTILASSREALNLDWEHVYPLDGLAVPEDTQTDTLKAYSAVQLFAERAQRVQRRFSLEEERTCVVKICRLVNGMPLGIELAAGWVRTLRCSDLAEEIEQSLDFLTSRSRSATERHRSLRAVFEHSWNLLIPPEQDTLMRLSVFRGSFDRSAAKAVADASLPVLSILVDKSLLRVDDDGRYNVHELLRQYAAEKLDAAADSHAQTLQRHMTHYADTFQRLGTDLEGHRQLEALAEIDAEYDNIMAAWNYAIEQTDVKHMHKCLNAIWQFHDVWGHFLQGAQMLQPAIDRLQTVTPVDEYTAETLGWALAVQSWFTGSAGHLHLPQTQILAEQSEQLLRPLGNGRALALALCCLAEDLCCLVDDKTVRGQRSEGLEGFEEALAIAQSNNDVWMTAIIRSLLSQVLHSLEQPNRAEDEARAAHSIAIQRGAVLTQHNIESRMAINAFEEGDFAAAEDYRQRELQFRRKINHPRGIVSALTFLASLQALKGNYTPARAYGDEALSIAREIGAPQIIAFALEDLWEIAVHGQQDFPQTHVYLQECIDTYATHNLQAHLVTAMQEMALLCIFEEYYADAKGYLDRSQPVAESLNNTRLLVHMHRVYGVLAYWQGHYDEAYDHFQTAIALEVDTLHHTYLLSAMSRIAFACHRHAEVVDALQETVAWLRNGRKIRRMMHLSVNLGEALTGIGHEEEAIPHYREALQLTLDWQAPRQIITVLVGLIPFLMKRGHLVHAADALALAWHHPSSDEFSRFEARRRLALHESILSPEQVTAVREGDSLPYIYAFARTLLADVLKSAE